MTRYMKISTYAKQHDLSYNTVWRNFHKGLIPGYQDPNTKTIYIEIPPEGKPPSSDRAALYARVSSTSNKASLNGQLDRMRSFAAAKGYRITSENTEIASGLNENRKTLWKVLDDNTWDILIVEHKDRLTRFGYAYIEALIKEKGKQLEIINEIEPKGKTEEIMEDFVAIVTSFCSRIYGSQRKKKTEKIIEAINGQ